MKIYEKCNSEPYFFINDTTLPSNNPLRFRKNLLKWVYNNIMTIDDKNEDEKLEYDINREVAKISALSSGKIDKQIILQGKKYYLPIKSK